MEEDVGAMEQYGKMRRKNVLGGAIDIGGLEKRNAD